MKRRAFLSVGAGIFLAGCSGADFRQGPSQTPSGTPARIDTPTSATPTPDATPAATATTTSTPQDSPVASDGFPDAILEDRGLDPRKTHIFVQVTPIGNTEYEPLVEHARETFQNAPIENPDGTAGIELHIDVDDPVDPEYSPVELSVGRPSRRVHAHHSGSWHFLLTRRINDQHDTHHLSVLGTQSGDHSKLTKAIGKRVLGHHLPNHPSLNTVARVQQSPDEMLDTIPWETVAETLGAVRPSLQRELEQRRDPEPYSETDTAGDGIPDELLESEEVFEGADPGRRHLFIEVVRTPQVTAESVSRYVDELSTHLGGMPLKNPDGTMGITVHAKNRGEIPLEEPVHERDVYEARYEHSEYWGKGHMFMVFTQAADKVGWNTGGTTYFRQPYRSSPLHEIGHSIGLRPAQYGVDGTHASFSSYPSCMNYNATEYAWMFSGDCVFGSAENDFEMIRQWLPRKAPHTIKLDDD